MSVQNCSCYLSMLSHFFIFPRCRSLCMTTRRCCLPTFTCVGTPLVWIPSKKRWLTAREKAAFMGNPVFPHLAKAAGYSEAPDFDVILKSGSQGATAHAAIGNAMFVPNVGCICLAAMACIELVSTDAPRPPGCPKKTRRTVIKLDDSSADSMSEALPCCQVRREQCSPH